METNILQFLPSKLPPLTIPINSSRSTLAAAAPPPPPTRIQTQFFFILGRRRSLRLNATNSTSSDETPPTVQPPTIRPPPTVEIKFKRGSKRRARQQKEDDGVGVSQAVKEKEKLSAPKKWEDMSLSEKAVEVYMGDKGLLFWLNKFAYASIFIMIGGWILFRFVGPALNLYQLDTDPLPPSSILNGS